MYKKDEDKIYDEVFSQYFTMQRERRGWTLEYCAEQTGLNTTAIFKYEKGLRTAKLSTFRKFCELYGLDYYETFKLLGEMVDMKLHEK